MSILVVPAFNDIKRKAAGRGGISDGGVHSERVTLTAQGVYLAPPKGVAYGGFNAAGNPLNAASVQAINFDPAIACRVEEYFVQEDGTQRLVGVATDVGANASTTVPSDNETAVQACSPFLKNGGILAYPHKLLYKLALGYGEDTLPTGRVLLHLDVVEFDLPKDQE
jgi:hypothetical protein